jgi:S1-C subfamily serine protease
MRRARTLLVAVCALFALAVATGTAVATTTVSIPTSLTSGIVVIKTNLALEDSTAQGTGQVLTSSGEILTNNHVIRGATSIKVVVPSTGKTYTAKVVGYDVADDVAILQAVGASNMKTVTTTTKKIAIGDAVTAIGNAGGTGKLTSATGKITRLNEGVTVGDDSGGSVRLTGMVGVNAMVIPGDSGGPLLDSDGEVIGMDTAGSAGATFRSTSATQAYAIPITKALAIEKKITAGTSTSRIHIGDTAFIGVQIEGGFRAEHTTGAIVAGVTSGGPAAAAGLQPGTVITAINGYAVKSPTTLTSSLLTKKPGQKVTITYSDQSGTSQKLTITLASGPPQ